MLYLAVRNGILIIVGIGYLYKIVKLEFFGINVKT